MLRGLASILVCDGLTSELNVVGKMSTRAKQFMTASGRSGHQVQTLIANLVLRGLDGVAQGILEEKDVLLRDLQAM